MRKQTVSKILDIRDLFEQNKHNLYAIEKNGKYVYMTYKQIISMSFSSIVNLLNNKVLYNAEYVKYVKPPKKDKEKIIISESKSVVSNSRKSLKDIYG